MDLTKKFVAYYRVSTEKQDLQLQKAYLKKYISEDELDCEFLEIVSGKTCYKNEQLLAAVDYCIAHKKIIAVSMIDRLGREAEGVLGIYRKLEGRIFACDVPCVKGEKLDKLMLGIRASLAEKERELISLRTSIAIRAKMAQGYKPGPKKPISQREQKKRNIKAMHTRRSQKLHNVDYQRCATYVVNRIEELRSYGVSLDLKKEENAFKIVCGELIKYNFPTPRLRKNKQDGFTIHKVFKTYYGNKYEVLRQNEQVGYQDISKEPRSKVRGEGEQPDTEDVKRE